jgi:predicted PurR-regulated permease PerM
MPNTPSPKPPAISFYIILAAVLFAFIQTFSLLSPILLSLLLVLLISLALNPVISWIRALLGGRKMATGLVTAALLAVVFLTGWVVSGPMKTSIINISRTLPEYWERLQKPLIKFEQQSVLFEEKLQEEVSTEIAAENLATAKPGDRQLLTVPPSERSQEESDSIRTSLKKMVQDMLGSFSAVAFNGAQILVVLVTVFFGVVFMLMNPRPIWGAVISLIPERHHEQAVIILQRIGKFVPLWAGATLLGMVTIGFLVFLLMWPIFGFMDALALGLVAGLFEAVPFLGPILSAVPALLLALGKGGMTPLWVVLVYLSIQAIENNLIIPFIMARHVKLHPVAVIFSMLLSIAAFGVLGVLVAVPLVAIVTILHEELYQKRYLPTVSNADLDHLAGIVLQEKRPGRKSPTPADGAPLPSDVKIP